jgi:cobalt-zinc-cadmium efflux system outer membrane protein
MEKINRILFLLCFLIIPGLIYSQSLDSLVNLAVEVSPKLKMLQAKSDAAESKVNTNSNLPDPMLTLGLGNLPTNTFSFTQEPMTGKIVGLSQAIPFPGKLSAVADVEAKDVDIIRQEINDARNEIVKNISGDYFELIYIRKAIDVANESIQLLQNIAKVVRINYSVSKASQQNILKVELEITNLKDKIDDLNSKENALVAKINAELLRPADIPLHTDSLPEIKYYNLTQQQLDSLAVKNRPFLTGTKLAMKKAELQQNLAKYDYYPNFNLMVRYSQRDKIAKTNTPLADFVSFMVGISLPLNYGGKVDSKVEAASAAQQMYEQQYNLSLQVLNSNFGASVAKLNSLRTRIKLIEDAQLPQAQQTYASSLSDYQVGKVDFINVIDAQNKLYQVETNIYRLKSNYLKEIENLKFLTGSKNLEIK